MKTAVNKRDDWNSHWQEYARATTQNPAQSYRHKMILHLIDSVVNDNTMKLLDIGSGEGDLLFRIANQFKKCELVGFELSESGVKLSRGKVPTAKFVVADIFQPSEMSTDFLEWATHATCSEVLEHVDDPIAFLKEVKKYLSDNAAIIITVPGGKMSAFDQHIGHRQHFTKQDISAILTRAGFKVQNIYRAGFPFFNLYRLIVIARGKKLVEDVKEKYEGWSKLLANVMMSIFNVLFHFNLLDSPFGWQIVVVARKKETII